MDILVADQRGIRVAPQQATTIRVAPAMRLNWPNEGISAVLMIVREEDGETLVDLAVTTTNQKGEVVVTGYATARVDP